MFRFIMHWFVLFPAVLLLYLVAKFNPRVRAWLYDQEKKDV
jgi:hypothetical protein